MGSLFNSKSTSVADPGATEAWNVAKPTQQYVNSAGVDFTQDVMANPAYAGQRVAGLNPFQTSGADFTGNFGQNFGQGFAQNLTGSGNSMMNAGAGYGQNANSIYSQYSGIDPTQQILANANQYANSPYATGMIDAANRDAVEIGNRGISPSGFALAHDEAKRLVRMLPPAVLPLRRRPIRAGHMRPDCVKD